MSEEELFAAMGVDYAEAARAVLAERTEAMSRLEELAAAVNEKYPGAVVTWDQLVGREEAVR